MNEFFAGRGLHSAYTAWDLQNRFEHELDFVGYVFLLHYYLVTLFDLQRLLVVSWPSVYQIQSMFVEVLGNIGQLASVLQGFPPYGLIIGRDRFQDL